MVGLYVRLKLHETPVFANAVARQERVKMPLVELFSQYWLPTCWAPRRWWCATRCFTSPRCFR
jgi:hypothetical protein